MAFPCNSSFDLLQFCSLRLHIVFASLHFGIITKHAFGTLVYIDALCCRHAYKSVLLNGAFPVHLMRSYVLNLQTRNQVTTFRKSVQSLIHLFKYQWYHIQFRRNSITESGPATPTK